MPTLAARSPVPEGLKIGDLFKIRGEDYALTSVSPKKEARLRARHGASEMTLHVDELVAWSQTDSISHNPSVSLETRHAVRLASLDEQGKYDWELRCEYVRPLLEYDNYQKTKSLVQNCNNKTFNRRQRRAAKKAIEKKPGLSTVYEWVALVKENGGNLACLAFKDHRKKPRKSRLAPKVESIVEDALDMLLNGEELSMSAILCIVEQRIKEANQQRSKDEEILKPPSKTTLRKRWQARNKMDIDREQRGQQYAFKHYNYGGKTSYGKFIGSRVEGDTNYVDCLVYDRNLDITYRPLLLLFMDCYTRAIVGHEISYLQRGSQKLARAMANMMSNKDSACFTCVPALVFVDNGKEFDNLTLKNIQDRTGIVFSFSPPYTPNCHAMIERFWETLNKMLLHGLKGTTKSNIFKRGYYESEELATYTIDELAVKLEAAINLYHHSTHSSKWLSPKTMWEEAIKKQPPRAFEKDTSIVLGSKYEFRKVSSGRVTFDYLWWHSPSLPENFDGETVQVCINESDLTHVWVINPSDADDIYKLDPVDPELQTGMSLDFWKSLRNSLEEREAQTGNSEDAARLRYEITMDIYNEAKAGKGKSKRKRARDADAAVQQLERMSKSIQQALPPSSPASFKQPQTAGTASSFSGSEYGIED